MRGGGATGRGCEGGGGGAGGGWRRRRVAAASGGGGAGAGTQRRGTPVPRSYRAYLLPITERRAAQGLPRRKVPSSYLCRAALAVGGPQMRQGCKLAVTERAGMCRRAEEALGTTQAAARRQRVINAVPTLPSPSLGKLPPGHWCRQVSCGKAHVQELNCIGMAGRLRWQDSAVDCCRRRAWRSAAAGVPHGGPWVSPAARL